MEFHEEDAHRFTGNARRTLALARLLGWRVQWVGTNRHVALLISPDGGKRLNIPSTNVNANRARSWLRQIVTHSDPNLVGALLDGKHDMMTDPDMAEVVALIGGFLVTAAQRADNHPNDNPEEATVSVTATTGLPLVQSITRWSPLVDARTWTDGTVDYACPHTGCEYVNVKPRAVQTHNIHKHPVRPHNKAKKRSGLRSEALVPPAVEPTLPFIVGNGRSAQETVDAIAALIHWNRLAELEAALAERDERIGELIARAEKAEGDMEALRDLLNGGGVQR